MREIRYLFITSKNERFEIHFRDYQEFLNYMEQFAQRHGPPELIYRLG